MKEWIATEERKPIYGSFLWHALDNAPVIDSLLPINGKILGNADLFDGGIQRLEASYSHPHAIHLNVSAPLINFMAGKPTFEEYIFREKPAMQEMLELTYSSLAQSDLVVPYGTPDPSSFSEVIRSYFEAPAAPPPQPVVKNLGLLRPNALAGAALLAAWNTEDDEDAADEVELFQEINAHRDHRKL